MPLKLTPYEPEVEARQRYVEAVHALTSSYAAQLKKAIEKDEARLAAEAVFKPRRNTK